MATGTFLWFGNFFLAALNKEVDLNSDVIKCMHTSATPNQDTWDYKDDVTSEITGTNVPAGGFTCDNVTVTYTAGTNVVKVDHDDEVISSATATGITSSVWYDSSPGSDATRPLIGYVTWSGALSPSAGTLTFTIDSAGLATITPA
jgi:hypothetical protein